MTSTTQTLPSLRILSLNVSYEALTGTRKRKDWRGYDIAYSYLSALNHPRIYPNIVPCSDRLESNNECFNNLLRFVTAADGEFDIITLIEASTPFVARVSENLGNKNHYRFNTLNNTEAIHVYVNPDFELLYKYTVNLIVKHESRKITRYRPIGILVFKTFVFVAVHLPTEKTTVMEGYEINGIVHQILSHIFANHYELPIVITGDFNNEWRFLPPYENSSNDIKTAFTFVSTNQYENELPLTYAYDRFVWLNMRHYINGIYLPGNYESLSLNLKMSDHLPIYGLFDYQTSDPPLIIDDNSIKPLFRQSSKPGQEYRIEQIGSKYTYIIQ